MRFPWQAHKEAKMETQVREVSVAEIKTQVQELVNGIRDNLNVLETVMRELPNGGRERDDGDSSD